MKFLRTPIDSVAILELEERRDDRGFFARSFCQDEFVANGLLPDVLQCNLSYNHVAGTLRGMHYQLAPATEAKLVRCISGAIVDIIVDLRPDSPTYRQHVSVQLSASNRRSLYVPPMFAHGFQTLVDRTEVLYQVSERYAPGMERGLRYDDPVSPGRFR
jgi:dTDP-4-dehydrorhamnose 3,5-epimerase